MVEEREMTTSSDTIKILFVGVLSYQPNITAARRLMNISRILKLKGVKHKIKILGKCNKSQRKLLQSEAFKVTKNVEIIGPVEKLDEYFNACDITVVPLVDGGGSRFKIIEAWNNNIPVISTSLGAEGLNYKDYENIIIATSDEDFSKKIQQLYKDTKLRKKLQENGRKTFKKNYSNDSIQKHMLPMYDLISNNQNHEKFNATLKDLTINRLTGVFKFVLNFNEDKDIFPDKVGVINKLNNETISQVSYIRISENQIKVDGAIPRNQAITEFIVKLICNKGEIVFDLDEYEYKVEEGLVASIKIAKESIVMCTVSRDNDSDLLFSSYKLCNRLTKENRYDFFGVNKEQAGNTKQWRISNFSKYIQNGLSFHMNNLEVKNDSIIHRESSLYLHKVIKSLEEIRQNPTPNAIEINNLKNKWPGETIWILGNGPSVRISDLEFLTDKKTFCFNRFYLSYDQHRMRPTFAACADDTMLKDFHNEMRDAYKNSYFFTSTSKYNENYPGMWLPKLNVFPPIFSTNPAQYVTPGGTTVYVALQLAAYFGFKNIIMYGLDYSFKWDQSLAPETNHLESAEGDDNHFIKNYRSGKNWCPPCYKNMATGY